MEYAKNLKFGIVVTTNKDVSKSCPINHGCHGYYVMSFVTSSVKI